MANYKKDSEEYKKRHRPITVVNNETKKNSTQNSSTASSNTQSSGKPAGVSQTEWNNERRVAEREKNSIRTDSGTRNNSTAANTERNTTTAMSNFRQLDNAQTQAVQDTATTRDKAAETLKRFQEAQDADTARDKAAAQRAYEQKAKEDEETLKWFQAEQDADTARDKAAAKQVQLQKLFDMVKIPESRDDANDIKLAELLGLESLPEENNGRNSLTSPGTGAITGTEDGTAPATTAKLTAYENQNAQNVEPATTATLTRIDNEKAREAVEAYDEMVARKNAEAMPVAGNPAGERSATELADQIGIPLPEMDGILFLSEDEIPPEMTAQYWENQKQIRDWEESNGTNSLTSPEADAITGTEDAEYANIRLGINIAFFAGAFIKTGCDEFHRFHHGRIPESY